MDAHTDTPASDRQTPMHINGKRVYGKREIEVRNPYTGEVVGTVPDADGMCPIEWGPAPAGKI